MSSMMDCPKMTASERDIDKLFGAKELSTGHGQGVTAKLCGSAIPTYPEPAVHTKFQLGLDHFSVDRATAIAWLKAKGWEPKADPFLDKVYWTRAGIKPPIKSISEALKIQFNEEIGDIKATL